MEKKKNKRERSRYIRELLIMAILLAIIAVTVSYAVVNVTLEVSGVSSARVANWSVVFDSADVNKKTGTAEVIQSPRIRGLNVHYEVRLNNPGDSVTIKAVVKNKGNMDAKLESYDVIGVPSQYEQYVSYKITGEDNTTLTPGKILKGSKLKNASERYMTVYITITYEQMIYEGNGYKTFDLGLGLNFVQSCDKC